MSCSVALITWFQQHADSFPTEPFQLSPGVTVSDPAKFYGFIRRAIETGIPTYDDAFLERDLKQLQRVVEEVGLN